MEAVTTVICQLQITVCVHYGENGNQFRCLHVQKKKPMFLQKCTDTMYQVFIAQWNDHISVFVFFFKVMSLTAFPFSRAYCPMSAWSLGVKAVVYLFYVTYPDDLLARTLSIAL